MGPINVRAAQSRSRPVTTITFCNFRPARPVTRARSAAFLRVRPVVVPAGPGHRGPTGTPAAPHLRGVTLPPGRWQRRRPTGRDQREEVPAVDDILFSRRRAERFAQLLDEANGARRHHVRSRVDGQLAPLVAVGQQLSVDPPAVEVNPDFRTGLRAMLLATAEREGLGTAPAASEPATTTARGRLLPAATARRARARARSWSASPPAPSPSPASPPPARTRCPATRCTA